MSAYYLFCNLAYGLPFVEVFGRSAALQPSVRHTIVLSTAHLRGSHWHRRALAYVQARRTIRHAARFCPAQFIEDVNASGFLASVPEGSIGIAAGFNQIFRARSIRHFDALINFHPSILPHYRGAIPSYWTLKNRELRTGFTAHQITENVDAGPILHQQYVDIPSGISEKALDVLIGQRGADHLGTLLASNFSFGELPTAPLPSPYHTPVGYKPATRK